MADGSASEARPPMVALSDGVVKRDPHHPCKLRKERGFLTPPGRWRQDGGGPKGRGRGGPKTLRNYRWLPVGCGSLSGPVLDIWSSRGHGCHR